MNSKIFFAVIKRIALEWWRCVTLQSSVVGDYIVILDAPILYESKTFLNFVSNVLVVSCDDQQQLERLVRRNPELGGEVEAKKRISAQMPLAEKRKRAGFVIDNSAARRELPVNVDRAVKWMASQPHIRYPSACVGGVVAVLAALFYAVASYVV
ncbi:dephospho-CoA kinase, putative [Bodo saltans]|uniref:Dephospho-CoA kinase, putative n=1 Tax=Bodo saltans TaxID=75058 RepID=A0A0S4JDD6_BODSA|nr:dephospho-CoA kinase, putative [Bodo saltans]|eukprot:CUG86320.1 dephospho-CoA kinase, putative [Bodo saltans]